MENNDLSTTVSRLFEVKRENVRKWLTKYGTQPIPPLIMIQTTEDVNRVKKLESEVSKLNSVIGQLHVELIYKNELIALAKERLGVDFEKKIKP